MLLADFLCAGKDNGKAAMLKTVAAWAQPGLEA